MTGCACPRVRLNVILAPLLLVPGARKMIQKFSSRKIRCLAHHNSSAGRPREAEQTRCMGRRELASCQSCCTLRARTSRLIRVTSAEARLFQGLLEYARMKYRKRLTSETWGRLPVVRPPAEQGNCPWRQGAIFRQFNGTHRTHSNRNIW